MSRSRPQLSVPSLTVLGHLLLRNPPFPLALVQGPSAPDRPPFELRILPSLLLHIPPSSGIPGPLPGRGGLDQWCILGTRRRSRDCRRLVRGLLRGRDSGGYLRLGSRE